MPSLKPNVSSNINVSLDDVCNLITIETEPDDLGQPILTTETSRQIFCAYTSPSRMEFSAAGQLGMKPDLVLIVDSDEYDNEMVVEYGGKKCISIVPICALTAIQNFIAR